MTSKGGSFSASAQCSQTTRQPHIQGQVHVNSPIWVTIRLS